MTTNAELKISRTLIQYHNQTYPIKNISYSKIVVKDELMPESDQVREERVAKVKDESWKTTKNPLKLSAILMAVGLVLLAIFRWSWIIGTGTAFFTLGTFGLIKQHAEKVSLANTPQTVPNQMFGIAIGLNSGDAELFWSQSKEFIHQVNDLIVEALSGTGDNTTTIINIDKQEINNTQHNTITNHYAIDIKHQHGYSAEDLRMLTGEFSQAIKDLGAKIEVAASPELKELFQDLVKQFNAEKPNKNTIEKLWGAVKKSADGFDVASKIYEASGLIMAAAGVVGAVVA